MIDHQMVVSQTGCKGFTGQFVWKPFVLEFLCCVVVCYIVLIVFIIVLHVSTKGCSLKCSSWLINKILSSKKLCL